MATKSLVRWTPDTNCVSKDRAKELVSAGLHRAVLNHGMGTVAKAGECTARTIENAISLKTMPELHTLGNILLLEPTVLWEYLSKLGFKIVPQDMVLSPDMQTATELSALLTMLLKAIEDGHRDHNETVKIAPSARRLILKLSAIVDEADEHRVGVRR